MRFTRATYMAAIERQRQELQNVGLYVVIHHGRGVNTFSKYIAQVAKRAANTKVLIHKRAAREGVDVRQRKRGLV